jgi:hypothetical protein
VQVIPGKNFVHIPFPEVERGVHTALAKSLLPKVVAKMFSPTVETTAQKIGCLQKVT